MIVQPDYQLAIYTPYGVLVDVLPTTRLLSLSYELKVNDVSSITVTVDGEDPIVPIITNNDHLDYICELYRRNTPSGAFEVEKAFFIRGGDIFVVEETGRENLIFMGVSPETLLQARIIRTLDDPVNAGGFVTRSGAGDAVMMDYVNYQCINNATYPNRIIPNFSLATFTGSYNQTFQRRKEEDYLLDVLQDIARQSFADFWVNFESSGFVFYAGRVGTDRSQPTNYPANPFVLFKLERNNIRSPRLRWDRRDEVNYVWVAGQGVGDKRLYVPVGSGRVFDSPFNYRESAIDAKTDNSVDEIISEGQAELVRTQPQVEFSFDMSPLAGGGRYNVDWFLGDTVTAEYRDYIADYRIIGVSIDVNEEGENIRPLTKTPPFGG